MLETQDLARFFAGDAHSGAFVLLVELTPSRLDSKPLLVRALPLLRLPTRNSDILLCNRYPLCCPRSMRSLDEFPEEVLVQIVAGRQRSYLVIQLWKCGSRNLSKKLASSVRSVDLSDNAPFSTSRWPKCLSSLSKLQHLSISLPFGCLASCTTDLQLELMSLPSSLERLEIDTKDCTFTADCDVPAGESISSSGSPIDLSTVFQSLQSLKLGNATAFSPHAPFYRLITNSIKELHLPHFNADRYSDPSLSTLPPKIETLHTELLFGDCAQVSQVFSSCPPSLTRILAIDIGDNAGVLATIPRDLHIGELKFNDIVWDYEFASMCPQGIEKMELSEIDFEAFECEHVHWADLLPKSLKSLIISESVNLDDDLIARLPRSITDLSGDFSFEYRDENGADKTLELPNVVKFTSFATKYHPDALRFLPQNLKSLSIRLDYSETTKFLPPVTDLCLYGNNFISIDVPFPNTITKLSLASLGGGAALHPTQFSLLPASLLEFEVGWFHDSIGEFDEDLLVLPPAMLKFVVDRWSLHWFSKLPRTLLDLSVELLDGFSMVTVEPTVDYFADLPTGLKRLMLGRSVHNASGLLPGCSLAKLHDLEYLNLHGYAHFDSSVLRTIYGGMKKLRELKMAMKEVRDEDTPYLPPWLRKCVFRDLATVSKELIANWPESATIWVQPEVNEALGERIKFFKERALMSPDPRIQVR